MSNLFQKGEFELAHAGKDEFKIECDALTQEDWWTLAHLIGEKYDWEYNAALGVPDGGLPLARELNSQGGTPDASCILIVDDVLTTGRSMEDYVHQLTGEENTYELGGTGLQGVVAFARNEPPEWVDAIFQMW